MVRDIDGRYLYANNEALARVELSADQLSSVDLVDVFPARLAASPKRTVNTDAGPSALMVHI